MTVMEQATNRLEGQLANLCRARIEQLAKENVAGVGIEAVVKEGNEGVEVGHPF